MLLRLLRGSVFVSGIGYLSVRTALYNTLPRLSLLALCALPLLWPATWSYAQDRTLEWDAVEDAASYVLYYGVGSRYNACIANAYSSGVTLALADDENADPGIFQYTVVGLVDDETYFFAVKAVDASNLESGYSNEEATLCIACDETASCDTPTQTATFYVNADEGRGYTVRGRADANSQVTLSDEYGNAWPTGSDSERNWSVANLNFESLYGISDQYVIFSVESGGVTSRVVTATYDVTKPESSASDPTSDGWYISVPWSASDATSGLSYAELWHKPPGAAHFTTTGQTCSSTSRRFYYSPGYGNGTYYFATRSVDKAGNWEDEPDGDGDTSVYYTAPSGSPGSWPNGYTGKEGGGGGCFIDTLLPAPARLPLLRRRTGLKRS